MLLITYVPGTSVTRSAHPPHLHLDTKAGSSFIPFCAYKTNMSISGPTVLVPNISFPICTAFKPTVLEGQLCYKLHVNASSGQGMKNGLSLLLDYQDELSLHAFPHPKEEKSKKVIENLNFDTDRNIHREVAKVHINTLSSFVGFGGGSYQMTTVKRMTATDEFIKMPLKDRNCEVDNCRKRKLLEECNLYSIGDTVGKVIIV